MGNGSGRFDIRSAVIDADGASLGNFGRCTHDGRWRRLGVDWIGSGDGGRFGGGGGKRFAVHVVAKIAGSLSSMMSGSGARGLAFLKKFVTN